ncbi:MAG: hypothetical protein ABIV06_03360 [Thermoanaerobaculia bacterium]
MTSTAPRAFALTAAAAFGLALLSGAPVGAADLDPAKVVTTADVEKVMGGKWTSRSPEPGVLFYEEDGTGYRSVHVYLWPADGKTVADMMPNLIQQGEPVKEVAGVGEAAMYRPQRNEATTEKKDKSGELLWLSIAVLEAASPADTKRFAVELAQRGVARI